MSIHNYFPKICRSLPCFAIVCKFHDIELECLISVTAQSEPERGREGTDDPWLRWIKWMGCNPLAARWLTSELAGRSGMVNLLLFSPWTDWHNFIVHWPWYDASSGVGWIVINGWIMRVFTTLLVGCFELYRSFIWMNE